MIRHFRVVYSGTLILCCAVLAACGDDSGGDANAAAPPEGNEPPTIEGQPPSSVMQGVMYSFEPTAEDPDGDVLTFSVENAPDWASFDTNTGRLEGMPDAGDIGTYEAIGISVSDGTNVAALASFSITVRESTSNQAPTIAGDPPTQVIAGKAYSFTPTASDADGDGLSFSIRNRPSWAQFNPATGLLSGTPAATDVGSYGNIEISVTDGQASAVLTAFTILVEPAPPPGAPSNAAPTISGNPPSSATVGVLYSFRPTAADADGDGLTFTIENRPSWATFNGTTGRLRGTPSAGNVGTYADIVITVSDGEESASLAPFTITVQGAGSSNTAPAISGTPAASVTAGQQYSFTPSADDPDGDTLTFSISNRPDWATFNGTTGRLSGTPDAGDVGSYGNIVISVSDGQASSALAPFSIEVRAASPTNTAPTISGNPATSVTAGQQYVFTPSADDDDGDSLTFSIQNRPSWASFNSGTGRLSGIPDDDDAGSYADIVIRVSDGEETASLSPFSIEVVAAPATNRPPTISGNPTTSVMAGQAYSFRPSANDDDGDTLTFSISNQPAWANFNSSTGRLSGTPDAGDVGTYENIVISVSDGEQSVSLPGFDIEVVATAMGSATVSWTPPTTRTDGSPLTNLAGYKVYWGTTEGQYPNSVTIDNAGVTTYVVENLTPATYYFVATALDESGAESEFSNVASKTIP